MPTREELQAQYDALEAQIEATADPVLSAKLQAQQRPIALALERNNEAVIAVVSSLADQK